MGGGLASNNPVIVDAFHSALRWQALIALLLAVLAVAAWTLRRMSSATGPGEPTQAEHPARRLVRLSFGVIWIVDGALQAQAAMPLGMPDGVVRPAASTSPAWVQHLVDNGLSVWARHPIPAAAAAVWIQVGIGALLLLSPRGAPSRIAGAISVYWGLLVWVFGEAFGGIFGSGLSWMFGAPGAAVFYCVAGLLIALPEDAWSPRLGRRILGGLGAWLLGMAVLQAWPGRGFWQGQSGASGTPGGLAALVQTTSRTPQPHLLTSLLTSFATFDAAHGWAVNLFVVAALGATGAALLSGRRAHVATAAGLGVVLCLADWILVQDLGFLGGLGTDPNSMIPTALLLASGAMAALRAPVTVTAPALVTAPAPAPVRVATPAAVAAAVEGGRPARLPILWRPATTTMLGVTASVAAFAIVLLGVVPMASAAVNPHTDAILTEALNGAVDRVDTPAPAIDLVDQSGRPVTLNSLRGRTVALTFLDPVCSTDCPVIAQQFRAVDRSLAAPAKTAFIAIVANPVYRQEPFIRAFDHQEQLDSVSNWYFLTGSLAQLGREWTAYGIEVESVPAGAMAAHSDNAFVIDAKGRLRDLFGGDPGDSAATARSLGTMLESTMRSAMRS